MVQPAWLVSVSFSLQNLVAFTTLILYGTGSLHSLVSIFYTIGLKMFVMKLTFSTANPLAAAGLRLKK
jgi:hypothetical protein